MVASSERVLEYCLRAIIIYNIQHINKVTQSKNKKKEKQNIELCNLGIEINVTYYKMTSLSSPGAWPVLEPS